MDPSSTDREMNAVDSENKNNLLSDSWRLHQLVKSFGNPKHPYSRFSTGNLQTLSEDPISNGIDIRKNLLEFHQSHYSSNLMNLVILGKEDLDTLENWATELFKDVKNKNLSKTFNLEEPPILESSLPLVIHTVPVKDAWGVYLQWITEPTKHIFKKQIGNYLGSLIGHEADGSLFALLKEKGWANSLVAGNSSHYDDFDIFTIDIDLTKDGFEKRDEVIRLVFEYLEMMRKQGPQEWFYEEMKLLEDIEFKYLPLSRPYSYVHNVASLMSYNYPPEEILHGPYIFDDFDKDTLSSYVNQLTPERAVLVFISKEFEGQTTHEEKWYGTKYFLHDDSKAYMNQFENITSINENLRYPKPNEFIPNDLSLKEIEKFDTPVLIKNTPTAKCWHYPDTTFKVPHTNLRVSLQIPSSYSSPKAVVMTRVLINLYCNALNEFAYSAHVARISYNLSAGRALDLHVEGFSQKLPMFVKKLFEKIVNLEIQPDRFLLSKEKIFNVLKSKKKKHAYVVADEYMSLLSIDPEYRLDDLITSAEMLTLEDIRLFHSTYFKQMTAEWLICGNILKEEAIELVDGCEAIFNNKPVHHSLISNRRVVKPPKGKDVVFICDATDPENKNSALFNWYPISSSDNMRSVALAELCGSMLSEPAYSQLRTQEQLGYIVWASSRISYHVTGFRVTIQSEKSPDYLDERVEDFLSNTEQTLIDMPDKEFDSYRTALIARVLEKPHSLSQITNRFWGEINSKVYNFTKLKTVAKELETVTKQEFIDFFLKHIKNPETRRKYSVRLYSNTLGDIDKSRKSDEKTIYVTDAHVFKREMSIYKTSILSHEAIVI